MHNLVQIVLHCALWSVLSVGGNAVALGDIYRYTVNIAHWLTGAQFVAFFAISQALPGPNGMALVLIGQQAAGVPGALAALLAKLAPSSLIAYAGATWYERNQSAGYVQTARAALVPITVGLILAASFVLARAVDIKASRLVLTLAAAAITYRFKSNPIWLIAGAALLGLASALSGAGVF